MRLLRLFVLLLFQVLVFNQIHLLDYITPLVIGYMLVCVHRGTSRSAILIWGFIMGLLFDIFTNTAGMAAASLTLVGMIQPVILKMMSPRDSAEDFVPSITTMGFWRYILFVLILMLVLHGAFYMLDAFTLSDWQLTLISIAGSTVLTTIIIIFIELLVRSKRKNSHY